MRPWVAWSGHNLRNGGSPREQTNSAEQGIQGKHGELGDWVGMTYGANAADVLIDGRGWKTGFTCPVARASRVRVFVGASLLRSASLLLGRSRLRVSRAGHCGVCKRCTSYCVDTRQRMEK